MMSRWLRCMGRDGDQSQGDGERIKGARMYQESRWRKGQIAKARAGEKEQGKGSAIRLRGGEEESTGQDDRAIVLGGVDEQ